MPDTPAPFANTKVPAPLSLRLPNEVQLSVPLLPAFAPVR
ncbi:hypothetical protein RLIN73S_01911 [Rhodanobacter lindaniclasticus]